MNEFKCKHVMNIIFNHAAGIIPLKLKSKLYYDESNNDNI